jgi:tetratricopeptide (TPR) repeat protein
MLTAFLAVAALAMAQKPKSQKELDGLIAIQNEQSPAAKIALIDAFIVKFADTEFKIALYTQAAEAAQRIPDSAKVIIYSELAIESDPKAYHPMLMVAGELARTTRENDLDKEEKLVKADKLARQAMDLVPNAARPNPKMTDDEWAEIKKELLGDGHRDLGMIASVQKKYDVAIAEFKQAVEIPAQPHPATNISQAAANTDNKQPDEALAVLAKMPSNPQLVPFADKEKKRAEALKAVKK